MAPELFSVMEYPSDYIWNFLFSTLNPPFLFLTPGELAFLPPVDELVEICSGH